MAVTADEYELPIAIADTSKELGEILGIDEVAVRSYKRSTGRYSGRKIVRVTKDDCDSAD